MPRKPPLISDEQRAALAAVGSEGVASMAIMVKLLRALITKGVLAEIEVQAILDAAAGAVERATEQQQGRAGPAASGHIRHLLDHFQKD